MPKLKGQFEKVAQSRRLLQQTTDSIAAKTLTAYAAFHPVRSAQLPRIENVKAAFRSNRGGFFFRLRYFRIGD
jgi:hypothetical protein